MLSTRHRLPLGHPALGCYYKGPRPQLGNYRSPQLGQIEAGLDLISGIKNFFSGLFGKDPSKANYDNARQLIWQQFAKLVDTYGPGIDNYTLSKNDAQTAIAGAEEFRRQLTALTDQYRTTIDAAWLEPRYQDFYNFMTKVISSWKSKLPQLPGTLTSKIGDIFTTAKESSLTPLLLTAGLLLLGRR